MKGSTKQAFINLGWTILFGAIVGLIIIVVLKALEMF